MYLGVSPDLKLCTTFLNIANHGEITAKFQFTGTAKKPHRTTNFVNLIMTNTVRASLDFDLQHYYFSPEAIRIHLSRHSDDGIAIWWHFFSRHCHNITISGYKKSRKWANNYDIVWQRSYESFDVFRPYRPLDELLVNIRVSLYIYANYPYYTNI